MKNKITYAYIETTNYCNLNCSFCNRSSIIKHPDYMSLNDFKLIINEIKDYPIKEAKLMGMGEPFLNPEYHSICEYFKKVFPSSYLISSTNAQHNFVYFTEKCLEFLDMLYISIDGYEETYEKFRKGARWEKLIMFLEKISSSNRYNCKLVINYVVTPHNVSDIEKIKVNILEKFKLDELRLNIVQNWSENNNIEVKFSNDQLFYLKEKWKNNIKGKWDWNYSDCFWPDSGVYINVYGDVRVCCMNTDSPRIGNIFQNKLTEIYEDPRFLKISNGCKTNNPDGHCRTCSYKELSPILKIIKND